MALVPYQPINPYPVAINLTPIDASVIATSGGNTARGGFGIMGQGYNQYAEYSVVNIGNLSLTIFGGTPIIGGSGGNWGFVG